MDFKDTFSGKKITVMRIGLLGRGVGDTAFLAEMGAQVLVVDSAPQEVMQPSVDALSQYSNVTFKFGPYDTSDFTSCDYVLVGAGTPLHAPELAAAREAGVPLKQSAAWFAELAKIPIIGVTGTRGKSTVTHMIHHVLCEVTGEEVLLGGNVRGVSNLQLLTAVKEDSLCVMELDSWQLQGWGWAQMSPLIAVFTNFMPDHLNYYKVAGVSQEEAMGLYFKDKANIFRYQDESGVFITTPEVFALAKLESGLTLGQEVIMVDDSVLPEDTLLAMPGAHNRQNAALAYQALKAVSLTDDEIFAGLASFPGVPGRLQFVGERNDVRIINDNNSTTPQATIAGLKAVGDSEEKNIVLVVGGAYKNIDPTELIETIPLYCKAVILLPGTGSEKLKGLTGVVSVETMEAAVSEAFKAAKTGDTVLFSPGFASFGLFKNEYERNDAFIEAIKQA